MVEATPLSKTLEFTFFKKKIAVLISPSILYTFNGKRHQHYDNNKQVLLLQYKQI